MSNTSTVRLVYDKLVVDNDMDSDTAAESDLSLKSRPFLIRGNDRVRKMLNRSPEDSMQDIDKRSTIGECLCLRHWKHLYSWERITQTIYIPSRIRWKIFLKSKCSRYLNSWYWNNQMRFLECLKSAGKILHGNDYLWSVMKKSSVSRMQRFTYFQNMCFVLERWIRTQHQILSGKTNWRGSKVHHNTEFWTQLTESRWSSSRVFPGFTFIAARPRSPKVHEQNGRTRTIPRTNYLHVDVQWHHMVKWRQWNGMYC